jgi:hypothetical protein
MPRDDEMKRPPDELLPLQRFVGDGRLEYADGQVVECAFEVTQQPDGATSVTCEHDRDDLVLAESLTDGPAPCRLVGATAEGVAVTAAGEFLQADDLPNDAPVVRGVRVRYIVNGRSIEISRGTNDPVEGPLKVRFALVNLTFTGTQASRYDYPDGGVFITHNTLPLTFGTDEFAVLRVNDYEAVIRKAKAEKRSASTAVLIATAASREAVGPLTQKVDRLCALFTLATGAKVSWAAYDVRSDDDRIIGGEWRSPVSRRLSRFDLIDPRTPDNLKHFVEAVFTNYTALESTYQLGRVIDARVDAISGGFLETRTLIAGVLVDFLTARFGTQTRQKHTSFVHRLRHMVTTLGVQLSEKEIRDFVATRHHLAHEMEFRTSEKTREYRMVMHVVNLLLMALLQYDGPFADCRTWQIIRHGRSAGEQQNAVS